MASEPINIPQAIRSAIEHHREGRLQQTEIVDDVVAPAAIGAAYLRLAQKQADKNDLAAAIALARTGLEFNSKDRDLSNALLGYQKAVEQNEAVVAERELEEQRKDALAKASNKDPGGTREI